jgi:hypothetical protein
VKARVRKIVSVNTDDYEKGCRRGEQIQRMQAYYGEQRQRRLYDLGVVNIKRLNTIFTPTPRNTGEGMRMAC